MPPGAMAYLMAAPRHRVPVTIQIISRINRNLLFIFKIYGGYYVPDNPYGKF